MTSSEGSTNDDYVASFASNDLRFHDGADFAFDDGDDDDDDQHHEAENGDKKLFVAALVTFD